MYYLNITRKFDASHFLKLNYNSPCTNQHGHTWKVEIKIAGNNLNENGMLADFTLIKQCVDKYDHKTINKIEPFNSINPTAENLAKIIGADVQDKMDIEMNKPVCFRVNVWETEDNCASWELEE